MDIYREIEKLSEEELHEYVEKRIKKIEEERKTDINEIGYLIDHKPRRLLVDDLEDNRNYEVTLRCFYNEFIPKGTKIIYGVTFDQDRIISNEGHFYFVDDDSYIEEFCRFIQDKEIETEYELFDFLEEFMIDKFGSIPLISRSEMHRIIYKSMDRDVFEPTKKRVLSDFYKKGNALCSEYSLMAQNILSFFGFDACFVIGREQTGDTRGEGHAYNFVSFVEDSSQEPKYFLIDFSLPVPVYNFNFEELGKTPYIIELDNFDEVFLAGFLKFEIPVEFADYCYQVIGENMSRLEYDRNRSYSTSRAIEPDIEKSVKQMKKTPQEG